MRVITESKIDGDFEGMDFDRIFTLENGQQWEQVQSRYRYVYLYMPRATVLEDGGKYLLRVDGFFEDIEVRRV